jgi:transcription elongation factor GreA
MTAMTHSSFDLTVVQPGSTVVLARGNGRSGTYQVVSSLECDPAHGKISDRSSIGLALLGKRAGDSVTVKLPGGVRELLIKEVR